MGFWTDRQVVVTGGAEGSGGIYRRAAAIVRRLDDVTVVAICGRNRRLHRRLTRLAARSGGRLTALGFVDNMAEWLRCADLVVSKAGPGTIAEASCCGAPLVLTLLEAAEPVDLVAEDDFVAGILHRFGSTKEPPALRGVRWSHHTDGIAFDDGCRSTQAWRPRDGWYEWRALDGRHCLFCGVRSE